MARLAAEAEQQVADLIDHYTRLGRDQATARLLDAVQEALDLAGNPGARIRPYPAGYLSLRSYGLSWLKEHRYWFGFTMVDGEAVITNVFYDAADIPNRLNPPG